MPIAVEPDGPTWKVIAIGALGLAQVLFAAFASWVLKGLRNEQVLLGAEQLRQRQRITKLEIATVTREELDKHIQRVEEAMLRRHEENKETNRETKATMERIEQKVDRGTQTRHDIRDSSHAVQTMMREILERLRRRPD